ncbi:hypothetical protein [Ovoidimarina sediminis]|uniref:hypothetical protein n=1 Tax=Ovoidimarina sediminis TaxID=3079856 RepID=UPI0029082F6F|nr:hypothetical protein [Rhodophyticola sp. MJ-SS7]MDU8946118.1 hypothetical protein [Rhodophyticola sp. MJ-SS7]
MSERISLQITSDIQGAIMPAPDGLYLVSAFHAPTGNAVYGIEDSAERALGWLEAAQIALAEPVGTA